MQEPDAATAITGPWEMWAHRYDDGRFDPVGPRPYVLAHGFKEPLLRVLAEEVANDDPAATHWGWLGFAWAHHSADTEPHMIWGTHVQFEMCFTYGVKAEVDLGRGRVLRLRVTEIPG